jgi:hypothetical protein
MAEDHDAISKGLPTSKELAVPPIPKCMRLISNAIKTTQSQQPSWLIASKKTSYVAPWMDAARSIGESLKGANLWVNEHQNGINYALRSVQQFRENMNTAILPIIKQFNDGFSSLAPIIEAGLKAYKARLESYPHLSQHFELLAKHGWFLLMRPNEV